MNDPVPPTAPAAASALSALFVRRTLFVLAVVAVAALLLKLTPVLLLLFGSVLVAVLLRAVADPIRARTRMPEKLALALAVALVVGVISLAVFLFQREVSTQLERLPDTLPEAWEALKRRLLTLPFGPQLVERLEALRQGGLSGGGVGEAAKDAAEAARKFFGALLGGLANAVLVLIGGLYLAIRPQRYRDGFLMLLPRAHRPRVGDALDATGQALNRWLVGTVFGMVIVGVMVGAGLAVAGLPSPILLGVLAGLGEFVPLIGPTAAMIPGVLLALGQGPEAVLLTVAIYVGMQQIQSDLIVPLIQKRMVHLPPLITIFSLAVAAVLFGPSGVLIAVPLAVVVFVLVKTLYVRDVLGEEVELPGRGRSSRDP